MSDIVDRLRSHAMEGSLMYEAADEIERLLEALEKINSLFPGHILRDAQKIARAAIALATSKPEGVT